MILNTHPNRILKRQAEMPGAFSLQCRAHVGATSGFTAAAGIVPWPSLLRPTRGQRGARFKSSHNEKNRPMRSGFLVKDAHHFRHLHCASM